MTHPTPLPVPVPSPTKPETARRKFENVEYRRAFAEAILRHGISHHLRVLMRARGWKQEDLAREAGMKQGTVSRLLDPNYGRYTLSSLLKLAAAFDVAIDLRFISFARLQKRLKQGTFLPLLRGGRDE